MNNEYNKAEEKTQEKVIEKQQLRIACMSDDIETIVDRMVKAESVIKLIADTYHLTEATSYFDPSINDTSLKN
jgi:CO dehydrogenase/acetyl-CoA synthase epsilon subunit|tara:strand:- start:524 stop:742 length:219 start_codon:yes stop_codon:yes gene_type:complete